MSYYILDGKTYEVSPTDCDEQEEFKQPLTNQQLKHVATVLSEHFGCFMLFGMSLKGEPQVLFSTYSGMESLALKKFAEDVVLGEADVGFSPLDDEEEEI